MKTDNTTIQYNNTKYGVLLYTVSHWPVCCFSLLLWFFWGVEALNKVFSFWLWDHKTVVKIPQAQLTGCVNIRYLTALAPSTLERHKRLCITALVAYLKPHSPEFQIQSLHPKLLSAYILYSLHAINYCQRTSHCDMHLHNLSVCKGRERCLVFLCLFIRFKTLSDLHLLACFPCLYVSHMWCYSYIILACGISTDSMAVLLSWVNLSGS